MKHSVFNRIVIGKILGLLAGIIAFFVIPLMGMPLSLEFALGLALLWITMGAMIGLMGIMNRHPIFDFPLPFWLRGAIIGLAMHLILALIAYDQMASMVQAVDMFGMQSPYWVLIDGIVLGIIMDWAATKFAGEGNIPVS